jgi:hypothetical protein
MFLMIRSQKLKKLNYYSNHKFLNNKKNSNFRMTINNLKSNHKL